MKRRILLVDDEVAVLLTLKAVLEISGFEVDTAASAREGKSKLRNHEYNMVITDMRMETDESGAEVIEAARSAGYHPAVALLTAFPLAEEDWQDMGADKMLVKPMHTRVLLQQIEKLLASHEAKLKNGAAMNGGGGRQPAAARKNAKAAPAKGGKTIAASAARGTRVKAKKATSAKPARKASKASPR